MARVDAKAEAEAKVVRAVFGDKAKFEAEVQKQREDIEYGRMLLREAAARSGLNGSKSERSSDDG